MHLVNNPQIPLRHWANAYYPNASEQSRRLIAVTATATIYIGMIITFIGLYLISERKTNSASHKIVFLGLVSSLKGIYNFESLRYAERYPDFRNFSVRYPKFLVCSAIFIYGYLMFLNYLQNLIIVESA